MDQVITAWVSFYLAPVPPTSLYAWRVVGRHAVGDNVDRVISVLFGLVWWLVWPAELIFWCSRRRER